MKRYHALSMIVLSLCLTAAAPGQRTLRSDEIQQIFEKLTSQTRTTWIPAGTIRATHEEHGAPKTTDPKQIQAQIDKQVQEYQSSIHKIELASELQKMKLDAIPFNVRYKLSNEHTMSSSVVVKYDGQRFYWEVDIDSRQDSVTPEAALAGNYMTDQFDFGGNRKRVFTWDGDAYTTYAVSGRCATVDTAGRFPRAVNGPLTAGLVPWGHGRYSYANLSTAAASATELSLDGKTQVQMSLRWSDGSSASLTLDPAMGYAVTACTLPGGNNTISVNSYGGFQLVAGNWVPTTIALDRRDAFTNKLLGSELWTLTDIDDRVPALDSFTVNYEEGTFIQHISTLTAEPSTYIYSKSIDTDRLLADRLTYVAAEGRRPQNCATAAVGYVASRLGKSVPQEALPALVNAGAGTTLQSMKRFIQDLGLHCLAVRTDPAGLRDLGPAKAILHVPHKDHVVVLDSIHDGRVQIVDLSSSKFCYHYSVGSLQRQWPDGVALLVSSEPLGERYVAIDDAGLDAVVGADGWSCTYLLQKEYWFYCAEFCMDYFTYFWKRYGCEMTGSGWCEDQVLERYRESACIIDPINYCTVTGIWDLYYMWACK